MGDDDLRDELRALRERVDAIERRLPIRQAPAHTPPPPAVEPVGSAPKPITIPLAPKPKRPRSPELETRVGLTLINRVGVVTLLLGAGFFFKYAVENEWIGPIARVIIGVAAGAAALAGGDMLHRRNQRLFSPGLSGLGIALMYLSVYAAYEFYQLIPNVLAFALLVAITGGGAALAVHYEAIPVAALGLFGGYLTPILVRPALWVLYGYTLLLNTAAVGLSRERGWRPLEILSLTATAVLYASSFQANNLALRTFFIAACYALFSAARLAFTRAAIQVLAAVSLAVAWAEQPQGYLLCSLALAAAALALRPTWGLAAYWFGFAVWTASASSRPVGPTFVAITLLFAICFGWCHWKPGYVLVMALNGPLYFAAAYQLLETEHHASMGLLAVSLAAAHLIAARQLFARSSTTALLALGLGAAFVTIAIPVQFSGYTITIAWAMEAVALAWIAVRFKERRAAWIAVGLLAMVLMRLAMFDRTAESARLVTFAASAIAFWLVSRWIAVTEQAAALYVTGHVILIWGLCLEITRWAARNAAAQNLVSLTTTAISIMLAAYAVAMVGAGVVTSTAVNRLLGLALIGAVIVKLYLYDVWLLGRLYRTIAFVALGALLVLSSFLYSQFRERIEGWWTERSAPQ